MEAANGRREAMVSPLPLTTRVFWLLLLLLIAVLREGFLLKRAKTAPGQLTGTLRSGDVVVWKERELLIVEGRKAYRLELRPNAEIDERNGEMALVCAEDDSSVSVESLDLMECRILQDDAVSLTQRQIEDRVINPHAEHSEDVWLVQVRELPRNFSRGWP